LVNTVLLLLPVQCVSVLNELYMWSV